MKKYFKVIKNSAQVGAAYNIDVFNWFLMSIFGTVSSLIIFRTAIGANAFSNYTQDQITFYIILGLLVERFINWYFSWEFANNILRGSLSLKLLKPINTSSIYVLDEFGKRLVSTLPYILFCFGTLIITSMSSNILYNNIPFFITSLFLASLINIFSTLIFSYLGFFVTRIHAFIGFYQFIAMYLSGRAFPIDILPDNIKNIIMFTPFPYTNFVTNTLLIKNIGTGDFIRNTLIQIFWIFMLFMLGKILWVKGIKKYESVGN